MITDFKDFKQMIIVEYDEDTEFYSNRIENGRLLSRKELLNYLKPNFFRAFEGEEELEDGYALLVSLRKKNDIKVLRIEIV